MKGLVKIEFLNFNCTFGESDDPFLSRFTDIVWPSLQKGYRRQSKGDEFLIENVEIKQVDGFGLVLVGIHIRSTELEIKSEYIEGKGLISTDKKIPSGPYSAFAIFLQNHRMIHIKNQKGSPTASQLGLTFQTIMNNYIRDNNNMSEDKSSNLPYSHVNITNIPNASTLKSIFSDLEKINILKVSLYALNGDVENGLLKDFRSKLSVLSSKSGNMSFNSPDNIDNVESFVSDIEDLGKIRMETILKDGKEQVITNESYKEVFPMYLPENEDDINKNIMFAVDKIKSNSAIRKVSEKNKDIYKSYKMNITRLMKKN